VDTADQSFMTDDSTYSVSNYPCKDLDMDGDRDNDDVNDMETSLTSPPAYTYSGLGNPYLFTGRTVDTLQHDDEIVEGDSDGYRYLQYNRNRSYDPKHGRWLQRDPLGVRPDAPYGLIVAYDQYADGMHLYLYVKGNPLVGYDPFGLRDWLDHLADFVAGVGDSLSFGITREVRKAISWSILDDGYRDEQVRPESIAYISGEIIEVTAEIAVTAGGAALRHTARRTVRKTVEGRARNLYRAENKLVGGVIAHINPIKGHPGIPTARYPLPFKFAAQSRRNMKHVTHAEHIASHRWMRKLESVDRLREMTMISRQAVNEIAIWLDGERGCGCWDSVDVSASFSGKRSWETIPPISSGGTTFVLQENARLFQEGVSTMHCHAQRR